MTTINSAEGETRNTVRFLGIDIDRLDRDGLLEKIIRYAKGVTSRKVMYLNADCMLLALKDNEYMRIVNAADLVYSDGIGVVLGARLWGHRLPGRMTGADFMPLFAKEFAKRDISIYLLGGRHGVAQEAAQILKEEAPLLNIVGTHHGYFDDDNCQPIIEAINKGKPHILLIGFGAPYQEKWIDRYADKIQVPVFWGVGGLFDFLSGHTKRGPPWLLDHGYEWLCRVAVEPRRLWKRYLIGNTKFVFWLCWYRFFCKYNNNQSKSNGLCE